jgi:uncharacterized paraquat-inducible protein A
MDSTCCPHCGFSCTDSTATCPLCQSSLTKQDQGRLLLWAVLIVELLAILVLNLAGKTQG